MASRSANGFEEHVNQQANLSRNARNMVPKGEPEELPDEPKERRQRGNGKAQFSLTFEHANGDSETLWYSHVYRMTFTGGHTLAIRFSDDVVTLTGRNLRLLRNLILSEMQDIIPVTARDRDFGKDEAWAVYGFEIDAIK